MVIGVGEVQLASGNSVSMHCVVVFKKGITIGSGVRISCPGIESGFCPGICPFESDFGYFGL